MPTTPTTDQVTCPSCAAPATGRFCASCGAPLAGALCASCRAPLTPGAQFCHRCGTAAGAAMPAEQPAQPAEHGGFNAALPWAVAGIALLALIALVAGQHFGRQPAPAPRAQEADAAPPDDGSGPAPVRGPDISSDVAARARRSPVRSDHAPDSEGKKDSAAFFAPMGISAYLMLPQQDADSRYDMGRIAEVAGGRAGGAGAGGYDSGARLHAPSGAHSRHLHGARRRRLGHRAQRMQHRLVAGAGGGAGPESPRISTPSDRDRGRHRSSQKVRALTLGTSPDPFTDPHPTHMPVRTIHVAHSPDSDDAFMFYALADGKDRHRQICATCTSSRTSRRSTSARCAASSR